MDNRYKERSCFGSISSIGSAAVQWEAPHVLQTSAASACMTCDVVSHPPASPSTLNTAQRLNGASCRPARPPQQTRPPLLPRTATCHGQKLKHGTERAPTNTTGASSTLTAACPRCLSCILTPARWCRCHPRVGIARRTDSQCGRPKVVWGMGGVPWCGSTSIGPLRGGESGVSCARRAVLTLDGCTAMVLAAWWVPCLPSFAAVVPPVEG